MSTRPPKPERDALRRGEIVTAAKRCVVRNGFHAASMASIATEAAMSVGQVYRYFENKEAIVHAIVEGITNERMAWIGRTGGQPKLAKLLATRMLGETLQGDPGQNGADRALLLEVAAEATRNPKVAEIARKADARIFDRAVAMIRADYPGLTLKQATARIEFIAVLSEGTAFRKLTNQSGDLKELTALYRQAIEKIFPARD